MTAAAERYQELKGGSETASPAGAQQKQPTKALDAVAAANEHLNPFAKLQELGGSYEGVNVLDASGIIIASSNIKTIGLDLSTREYIKKAMSGQANVGSVVISKVSGKPITPIALPMSENGNVVGALAMILALISLPTL